MIIIEDTRETLPLSFKKPYIEYVMRSKLDYGDYSAVQDGVTCPIYFDRKGLSDLFGTLSRKKKPNGESRMDVFKREIQRCRDDGSKLIIAVEGTYTNVQKGYKHSKIKGESITRTLDTLLLKYGVLTIYCSSRAEMSKRIAEFYYSYFKNLEGK